MNIIFLSRGWTRACSWAKVNFYFVNVLTFVFYLKWFCWWAGKKWSERRKVITPAFHFQILEQFVKGFDKLGNKVVDEILNKYGPEDEVRFYDIMVLYALDVMCGMKLYLCCFPNIDQYFSSIETAMGISIDALSKPNSEYVKAVKEYNLNYHVFMNFLFIDSLPSTECLSSRHFDRLISYTEFRSFLNILNCVNVKTRFSVFCMDSLIE